MPYTSEIPKLRTLVFCQLTNTQKNNIAHGPSGNPSTDGGVPSNSSDWGIFDCWAVTGSLNPFSKFTISSSGVTILQEGYYRISANILGSIESISPGPIGPGPIVFETPHSLVLRFAKNGVMEGPVAGVYIHNQNSIVCNSLQCSHILHCSQGDVLSVYTASNIQSSPDFVVQAKAGYSELKVELVN